jgi:hypothetical protein
MLHSMRNGCLVLLVTATSCDGGSAAREREQVKAAEEEQAAAQERAEAAAKAEAEAKRLAQERAQADAEAEQAYAAAKIELEPLATLPKKRPKGFERACADWLVAYNAFMQKTLEGDRLRDWTNDEESRTPALRRRCHERSVEAVVCQTQLLHKAPDGTDIDHILRVCEEKY